MPELSCFLGDTKNQMFAEHKNILLNYTKSWIVFRSIISEL